MASLDRVANVVDEEQSSTHAFAALSVSPRPHTTARPPASLCSVLCAAPRPIVASCFQKPLSTPNPGGKT
jgi:hypothetical protein